MRFSLWPNPDRPFNETLQMTLACESYGWHAVYVADHFMPDGPDATPLHGNMNEAITTLTALGVSTSNIRLGTLVAAATYRHPAVLAKSFATLDQITSGRTIVGLGAGWQVNEHASYGINLGSITERIDRFVEYVEIVASMLRESETTFSGTFYSVTNAPCEPRPAQSPPKILLGVKGAKRTLALAARWADVWNAWCSPEDLREYGAILDGHCEQLNRDPRDVEHTTQALVLLSTDEAWLAERRERAQASRMIIGNPREVLDVMAQYQQAGCDEFIVPTFTFGETSRALDTLALFNEQVVTAL